MAIKKCLLLSAFGSLILLVAVVTGALGQDDLPEKCEVGPYKIKLMSVIQAPGSVRYRYRLTANRTAIQDVSRIVAVGTRPLRPENINLTSATAAVASSSKSIPQLGRFCEPDAATRINEGDCDSFPISIYPRRDTPGRLFFEIEATVVTQGTMTMNIITERNQKSNVSTVNTCIADGYRGIKGPGGDLDPNAPVTSTAQVRAGICRLTVKRDSRGNISSVEPQDTDLCELMVAERPISELTIDGRKALFIPDGTILGASASPACYDFVWEGVYWKVCEKE